MGTVNDIFSFEIANRNFDRNSMKEVYWKTPSDPMTQTADKVQYVYHIRMQPFVGETILPLNRMPEIQGCEGVYEKAKAKYKGREWQMERVVTPFQCKWNDVVFLGPIHPHLMYQEMQEIGYCPEDLEFFQIPASKLNREQTTVWKWLDFPMMDSIHNHLDSYCSFDGYQEMRQLPISTREWYKINYQPERQDPRPPLIFYGIPHILYRGEIDISDKDVTVIQWKTPRDS